MINHPKDILHPMESYLFLLTELTDWERGKWVRWVEHNITNHELQISKKKNVQRKVNFESQKETF